MGNKKSTNNHDPERLKEIYKFAVIGQGGVGKTATVVQFCSNHFVTEYDPTIEDSYRKQVQIENKVVMLDILDTAGKEDFSALRDNWIREGEGFVLVYDITDKTSFEMILEYHERILQLKKFIRSSMCYNWK
eukprot:TRINITY_DN7936_c0_g1_i1.p1 TRINITY_DN7936_c0_g1~~TRINITY_DN7936_c0_g1_i1.p1  ORF type:complete len:132 (+),score=21.72 TRINITY_DN7936_c0_g1_i1:17-412(+)